jgi:hypothetical protein
MLRLARACQSLLIGQPIPTPLFTGICDHSDDAVDRLYRITRAKCWIQWEVVV